MSALTAAADWPCFYLCNEGEVVGPLSRLDVISRIIAGQITDNHFLFGPGAGDWQKFSAAACASVLGISFEKPTRAGERLSLDRLQQDCRVMMSSDKKLLRGSLYDISKSGMFVCANDFPFGPGESVETSFQLPNFDPVFKFPCEVTRLSYECGRFGYGLRFLA